MILLSRNYFLFSALIWGLFGAVPAKAQIGPSDSRSLQVETIADDFVRIWDATRDLPPDERLARFKSELAPLFPGYYDHERFEGRVSAELQDQRIAAAIESFPEIREDYLEQLRNFEVGLAAANEDFLTAFPDFRQSTPIWLVHSLGEMDGGVRTVKGDAHLIFGADVMAATQTAASLPVFFEHELFHVHHQAAFSSCAEIWCGIWREGLAVYVSQQLNPHASLADLSLNFYAVVGPDGVPKLGEGLAAAVERDIGRAWAQLEEVLDSTDQTMRLDMFQYSPAAQTGLPPRRGYYLGFLVASEVSHGRTLQELAGMTAEEVRPLVRQAVATLKARHAEKASFTP